MPATVKAHIPRKSSSINSRLEIRPNWGTSSESWATSGSTTNDQKFGDLGDGLYEFKSFQIRMPFAYAKNDRRLILITHGFRKKKDKAPPAEIARARRILEEDFEASKVFVITDQKQKRKRS